MSAVTPAFALMQSGGLVDDHVVVRQGLSALLETYDEIEVVGEAGSGAEGVNLAIQLLPDIVLWRTSTVCALELKSTSANPPTAPSEWLFEIVQRLMVASPWLQTPPPTVMVASPLAEFPSIVL